MVWLRGGRGRGTVAPAVSCLARGASQLGDTSVQPRGRELGGGSDRRAPVSPLSRTHSHAHSGKAESVWCVDVERHPSFHQSMFVLTAR